MIDHECRANELRSAVCKMLSATGTEQINVIALTAKAALQRDNELLDSLPAPQDRTDPTPQLVIQRLTDWLSNGGFFNPGLMAPTNEDATRQLILDARAALEVAAGEQQDRAAACLKSKLPRYRLWLEGATGFVQMTRDDDNGTWVHTADLEPARAAEQEHDGGVAETERRHSAHCREQEAIRQREADALQAGFETGRAARAAEWQPLTTIPEDCEFIIAAWHAEDGSVDVGEAFRDAFGSVWREYTRLGKLPRQAGVILLGLLPWLFVGVALAIPLRRFILDGFKTLAVWVPRASEINRVMPIENVVVGHLASDTQFEFASVDQFNRGAWDEGSEGTPEVIRGECGRGDAGRRGGGCCAGVISTDNAERAFVNNALRSRSSQILKPYGNDGSGPQAHTLQGVGVNPVYRDIRAFGQFHRVTLMIERARSDNTGKEGNNSQYPVRPDRRVVTEQTRVLLLFLCGAGAVGGGGLFAYRSKFVGDHPQIALCLLSAYACTVVGLIAWLG